MLSWELVHELLRCDISDEVEVGENGTVVGSKGLGSEVVGYRLLLYHDLLVNVFLELLNALFQSVIMGHL